MGDGSYELGVRMDALDRLGTLDLLRVAVEVCSGRRLRSCMPGVCKPVVAWISVDLLALMQVAFRYFSVEPSSVELTLCTAASSSASFFLGLGASRLRCSSTTLEIFSHSTVRDAWGSFHVRA